MKRINFKKISICNFLSIGDDPVEITFKQDINFITGVNKDKQDRQNAVGKTSVKRGIFWCIFGEDLYGTKTDLLVNNINKQGMKVVLDFDVDENGEHTSYTIIRNEKSCKLLKNGNDITLSTKVLTNNKICEIISATPEIFTNCVIMSLNDTIPFMSKKGVEKRHFIEQIFNFSFFDDMLKSIRKDFNLQKNKTDITFTKLNDNNTHLKHLEDSKIKFENDLLDKKNQLQNNISKLAEKIKQLQTIDYSEEINHLHDNISHVDTEIQKLQKTYSLFETQCEQLNIEKNEISDKLNEFQTTLKKIEIAYAKLSSDLELSEKNIDKFIKLRKDKICPVCYSETTTNENLQREETNIQTHINDIKNKLKQLEQTKQQIVKNIEKKNNDLDNIKNSNKFLELDNIKNNLNELNNTKIKIESDLKIKQNLQLTHNQQIDNLEQQISSLEQTLTSLNDNNPYINDIDNLKEQIKNIQIEYNNDDKQLKILNAAKLVVSDDGIKTILIKKVLNVFNSKLAYYLDTMQSNCICKFNEVFEETMTNERGVESSYFNFSGAEKKAIDLACLFSFMDMRLLLANVSYNLVIYDELIDSSLDSKGIDIVLEIIKNRVEKYKESTYIISHRKESLQTITGDIVLLEKRNGITRRIKN